MRAFAFSLLPYTKAAPEASLQQLAVSYQLKQRCRTGV
jgi:hypothetical protein